MAHPISGNHRLQVFQKNGLFLRAIGKGFASNQEGEFSNPTGLAFDLEGQIVVADTCTFDFQSTETNLELKANNRIQVLNFFGAFRSTFGQTELRRPAGVAVDLLGNYLVSDSGTLTLPFPLF